MTIFVRPEVSSADIAMSGRRYFVFLFLSLDHFSVFFVVWRLSGRVFRPLVFRKDDIYSLLGASWRCCQHFSTKTNTIMYQLEMDGKFRKKQFIENAVKMVGMKSIASEKNGCGGRADRGVVVHRKTSNLRMGSDIFILAINVTNVRSLYY